MKLLITGSAGFIGFHLAEKMLVMGHKVVGLDNINDYYDVNLKFDRLSHLGIDPLQMQWNTEIASTKYEGFSFIRANLEDKQEIMSLCRRHQFEVVVNLAAQAGVRFSITNPDAYIQSNLVGFLSILEACRHNHVNHLVYASSSSVYGLNEKIPFSVKHDTSHPVSLYAATKKANELMAHTYSHLYNIPTTGLRFFTVYGPWGRPDMACYLFADAIMRGEPIQVFNEGKMKRDFTYIDDIIQGVVNVIDSPAAPADDWDGHKPDPSLSKAPYRIYNIGNNNPVELTDFILELESHLGRKALISLKGMQPGDVAATWADVEDLVTNFNYRPQTSIQEGLKRFVTWYKAYTQPKPVTSFVPDTTLLG